MNENENITTVSEEEFDDIMPDGWHDSGDFFDEGTWGSGEEQTDEPAAEPVTGPEEETAAEGTPAPTPEQGTAPGDAGVQQQEAPTPEPAAEGTPHKLKFKARVDRQDLDVEVDEGELPTIWQKAQATDRAQAKLAKLSPQLEKAEQIAKAMGFADLESMMASAEQNYRDGEVNRLVGEGVHEEVAKDMVSRRFPAVTQTQAQVQTPAATPAEGQPAAGNGAPQRNFMQEADLYLRAYPEMRGKPIPAEVLKDCRENGEHLLTAYAKYDRARQTAEAEKIRRENEILKQNAASAAKAPVSGTRGGGPTAVEPEDDFLRGFNDGY